MSKLGLDKQRIRDWLSLTAKYWRNQSGCKIFQDYAKSLIVVNDPDE